MMSLGGVNNECVCGGGGKGREVVGNGRYPWSWFIPGFSPPPLTPIPLSC